MRGKPLNPRGIRRSLMTSRPSRDYWHSLRRNGTGGIDLSKAKRRKIKEKEEGLGESEMPKKKYKQRQLKRTECVNYQLIAFRLPLEMRFYFINFIFPYFNCWILNITTCTCYLLLSFSEFCVH